MKFRSSIFALFAAGASGAAAAVEAKEATVDALGSVTALESSRVFIPAVKSVLAIQIPANLNKVNGEGHHLAHFGLTKSRGSMSRFVYYLDEPICDPHHELGGNTTYPSHGNELVSSFFLLAKDVGGCTSVRMARIAQEFGASALILGEEYCHCHDKTCMDAFPADAKCLEVDPPLNDDGSGGDVTIPTTFLHKGPAEALYRELKNNDQPVLMELTWGLPLNKDDVPEEANINDVFEPHYHLWTTAHDPLLGAKAYEHFRTLAVAFGKTIHFSPRFHIQHGSIFNCPAHIDTQDSPCSHLCTNHGLYCASRALEVSGHEIVKETVRRLCIYQHYPHFDEQQVEKKKKNTKDDGKINTAYWDYVIYHLEHCSDPTKYSDEACVDEAYKAAKVDKANIDGCMKDTGDIDGDNPNSLLDEMLEKILSTSVVEIPALTLENRIHVEEPSAHSLFKEICHLFWEATSHSPYQEALAVHVQVPSICETCGSCANIIGCLEVGHCVPSDHSKHQGWGDTGSDGSAKKGGHGWTITFLILCAGGAGGAYYYYKKREELVGDGGRALLDGYMQMSSGR